MVSDTNNNISQNLKVTNSATDTLIVQVRRIENFIVPGSINSFCWGGQCYPPTTSVSTLNDTLAPGETGNTFFGDYYPMGNLGTSIVTYVFADTKNTLDTSFVTINYNITPVGVQTITDGLNISAYPNPTTGFILVDISSSYNSGTTASISCYDLIGNNILSQIGSSAGKTTLDLRKHAEGIYFVQVKFLDKIVTKKIVLSR